MRIKQHVLSNVPGVEICEVEFDRGRVVATGRGIVEERLLDVITSLGYVPRVHAYRERTGNPEL
jgi:hypothetical protein